ncbi:MAG: type II toxin-antitoxin system VapC family toxin [Deltaproteobacteria bacterium]|nr:type II toxin-antitoxin system VapC family toxin [Deltaproteobacteria bacterium]
MIVLDTHVLLWWALDPNQLSAVAAKQLEEMERVGGFVSSISFWELAIKVKRGKLTLPISMDEFVSRVARTGAVTVVPVDVKIWLASADLKWDHADPADRVIVSTALDCGVPLLTKDNEIRSCRGVNCIW